MQKKLFYFLIILLSACSSSVSVNEITNSDNIAYYNNKVFTGTAVDIDENDKVRVKVTYKDGIKILTELFYPSGNMQSEWKYGVSQISVKRFYKSGKIESEETKFSRIT